ncbi:hypothetical protein [Conexibacter sp. SYSU D00693]|uniref:hypothetical protein n=1 Tax=Conexibacter sp. SYSU D00693 TaxID=2812560 RepID=UPI00196A60A7|nr:hypothetical protein [Conexibacter sp. SYSU D00693]
MADIRETYDLPKRSPVPHRHWALMVGFVLLALVLGGLLHESAVGVALLAIALLTIVFAGVQMVLRSRGLREAPGSHPVRPPSAS